MKQKARQGQSILVLLFEMGVVRVVLLIETELG
jgi:hypothetical protein